MGGFASPHDHNRRMVFDGHWMREVLRATGLENASRRYLIKRVIDEREKTWIEKGELVEWLKPSTEAALAVLKKDVRDGDIIITFGRFATWLLTGREDLDSIRGTRWEWGGASVFPTFHPDTIGTQFRNQAIIRSDVERALRYRDVGDQGVGVRVRIPETVAECRDLLREFGGAEFLACDIETARGVIDCIGFAEGEEAFVIPLAYAGKERGKMMWDGPYWDPQDYRQVVALLRDFLQGDVGYWNLLPEGTDRMERKLYA